MVRDFSGVQWSKNQPCNAGDVGSIPGWGTKIPHAAEQLSLHSTTREPACHDERSRRHSDDPVCQWRPDPAEETSKEKSQRGRAMASLWLWTKLIQSSRQEVTTVMNRAESSMDITQMGKYIPKMKTKSLESDSSFQRLHLSLVHPGLIFFTVLVRSRRNKLSINWTGL